MQQTLQVTWAAPAAGPIPPRSHFPASSVESLLAGVGGLDVVFQPIFELRSKGPVVHAVEGLIRGPRGTQLESPNRLFGFFRPRGEGAQLDALCLDTVLRRAAALPGTPRLCLNVSAETVVAPAFLGELLRRADQIGVSPYRLILDVLLEDTRFDQARLVPAIREVRRYGIRLAYDEGSLFTSGFHLLMDAPPDYLKLHQKVLRSLGSDAAVRKALVATVELGHTAGFRVVAKGVERHSEVDAVVDAGIELVQGYHWARPAAARDPRMAELLRSVPGAWDDQHVR